MKCKIFTSNRESVIETEINDFLKGSPENSIIISEILQTETDQGYTITIFYEEINSKRNGLFHKLAAMPTEEETNEHNQIRLQEKVW